MKGNDNIFSFPIDNKMDRDELEKYEVSYNVNDNDILREYQLIIVVDDSINFLK